MNREIKFRAWDKNDSKGKIIEWDKLLENYALDLVLTDANNHWGIMQFTGLKDKNGKEIYEGDICKWIEMEGVVELEKKGFVRFDGGRFEIGNHNGYGGDWDDLGILLHQYWNNKKAQNTLEVIGNRFENPELLNNKGVKNEKD